MKSPEFWPVQVGSGASDGAVVSCAVIDVEEIEDTKPADEVDSITLEELEDVVVVVAVATETGLEELVDMIEVALGR